MTVTFASTAGGQRHCNAAVFASLEKIAAHFSNPPSADRSALLSHGLDLTFLNSVLDIFF